MNENRAAAFCYTRAGVVVDFNNEIVEMIVAPKPVAFRAWRELEGAVIAAVERILAPGVVLCDSPNGQRRLRPRHAVGAPPQPQRPEAPARRGKIAFEFVAFDSAAAERDRMRSPGITKDSACLFT